MQFSYSLLSLLAIASTSAYTISSNTHLARRAFGAIAVECKYESRLPQATTEQAFSSIMDDCNNAYSTLLNRDPSQQNAIALQNEIVAIKENFAKYKDNYFLTHPPNGNGGGVNPPKPGQTIVQRCNMEAKISAAQKREDFDPILASCSTAYTELLNADQNRLNELNSEWISVQNRIKVAQEEFAKTHPPSGGNNGGNNGDKSDDITKKVNFNDRLAKAHSYLDFDILIQDCNIAFVTLNTDSSKTVKLQNELEYLKAKVVKAKADFRP